MTNKPTVLLDVDGVLASFIAGALKSLKDLFGIDGTHDDIVNWHFETCFNLNAMQMAELTHAWRQPGWCAALPPYPFAPDAVIRLREHAVVHPLTAPFNSMPWMMERDAWLSAHCGFTRKEIVHTEAKHLVKGDVFVDDKPEHVINWQRAHPQGVAILWAQPYNADAVKPKPVYPGAVNADDFTRPDWTGLRTNDWNEVINIVKAMRWIPRRAR